MRVLTSWASMWGSQIRTMWFRGVLVTSLVLAACGPSGSGEQPAPIPPPAERTVSSARPGFPEVEIVSRGMSFEPSTIELRFRDLVNLVHINEDDQEHDLYVIGAGIHTHPNTPVYLPVGPGSSLAGELHAEASGEFEIVCTLPGHREAGHVATLIVD